MTTIRIILAGCFSMMVLSGAALALQNASGQVYTPPQSAAAAGDLLASGYTKFQNNDFAGALEDLRKVVGSPGFALLGEPQQHAAYYLLGAAEAETGDMKGALKMLQLSTQSSDSTGMEWHLRLMVAYGAGDFDDSIVTLTAIVQRWPSSLSEINDQPMLFLGRKAAVKSDEAAIALLEPLHQLHWTPKDKFWNADVLWLALAQAYADGGDAVHAAAALNDIHHVALLISIRADRRFDAAVRADPGHYDVPTAIASELADLKAAAAANPDKLEGVNAAASMLLDMGRASEALDLLDGALARAKQASGTPPFSDYQDQINWTHDQRAHALKRLGRQQEALDQMAAGARIPEHGQSNVSQAINLADAYDSAGRPQDALDVASDVELAKPSPYGMMALHDARACAYAQLHDSAGLKKSLDYLEAHESDGRDARLEALVCANELDRAAELVVRELKDPKLRSDTLVSLQDYKADPAATPFDKEKHERFLAIRSRPEVSQAIAAVGRIESYPLIPREVL